MLCGEHNQMKSGRTRVFLVFHFKKNQLDLSSYNVTQFPLFAREVLPFGLFGEAVPPVFPNPYSDFRPKRAIFHIHLFATTEVYVRLNDVIFALVRTATKQIYMYFLKIWTRMSYFDSKTLTNFRPSWWAKLGNHKLTKSIPVFRSTGIIHHTFLGGTYYLICRGVSSLVNVWTEKTCWGDMLVPS